MRPVLKRRRNHPDSDVEDIDCSDNEEAHPLAGKRTLLISGVGEAQYPDALLSLRSLKISVVQDDAPLCSSSGVMAVAVDPTTLDATFARLQAVWKGPGTLSVGIFKPVAAGIKLAIRAPKGPDGSQVVVKLTPALVAEYARSKGVRLDVNGLALNMVAPGTWQVTVDDEATALALLGLESLVVSLVELSVGKWKEVLEDRNELKVIVRNIARITSRRGLTAFMQTFGEVVDVLHGKSGNGMFAAYSIFTFTDEEGRDNALAKSGRKKMDGNVLVIARALLAEEQEAEAKKKEESCCSKAAMASCGGAYAKQAALRKSRNQEAIEAYERAASREGSVEQVLAVELSDLDIDLP